MNKKTNMTEFWFFWVIKLPIYASKQPEEQFFVKAISVEIILFALHCFYSNCWTVKVIMEVTSPKLFMLFMQGHFWHSVIWLLQGVLWPVEVAVSLAQGPNWQTEILCPFISGILNPCMFLHAIYYTVGPHWDIMITELFNWSSPDWTISHFR